MKPYYEESGITIYHGDCREILPSIEPVDLMLTDPPYGLPGEEVVTRNFVVCDISNKMKFVFTDWRNPITHPQKFGELIWEYGWISGGRCRSKNGYFPTHNTINLIGDSSKFKFIKEGSIVFRREGFSSPRQCSYAKKSGHPFEKPLRLLKWLIGLTDLESIIDPFVGSGSTLVAAKQLGHKAIGIEIEEKYCEIAAKRLQQEVFDFNEKK